MRSASCETCGRSLILGAVAVRGASSSVEVEIGALPVLHCPAHGTARFPTRDFGNELVEALWRVLRPTARRRLGFLGPRCSRDGTALAREVRASDWFEGALSVRGAVPEFAGRARVPSIRCPKCGLPHVALSRALDADVADALLAALRAAGIRPS